MRCAELTRYLADSGGRTTTHHQLRLNQLIEGEQLIDQRKLLPNNLPSTLTLSPGLGRSHNATLTQLSSARVDVLVYGSRDVCTKERRPTVPISPPAKKPHVASGRSYVIRPRTVDLHDTGSYRRSS